MVKEMSGVKKTTATKTIKKILISQAKPESEKSPYFDLERKYNVSLFFKPFIELEPIGAKEFRKTKIQQAQSAEVKHSYSRQVSCVFKTSGNFNKHFYS